MKGLSKDITADTDAMLKGISFFLIRYSQVHEGSIKVPNLETVNSSEVEAQAPFIAAKDKPIALTHSCFVLG